MSVLSYFCAVRFLKALLLFTIFFGLIQSCRKEEEIKSEMQPGVFAGKSAFRILSITHIIEQIALQRNDDFFTPQTKIVKTDSIYSDGDDIEYMVDFGKGVVCSDGILRRGKCRITAVDSLFPMRGNCKLNVQNTDSFGIYSKLGWEFLDGYLTWEKHNSDSADLEFLIEFSSKENYSVSTMKPIGIRYIQPVNQQKNGEIWQGKWILKYSELQYDILGKSMINTGACRSNWNLGFLEVSGNSGSWEINFDPFGNEACDQVFKVSTGKGLKTDEMTFDAW